MVLCIMMKSLDKNYELSWVLACEQLPMSTSCHEHIFSFVDFEKYKFLL